jgi:uncharacterized protein (DUF4415 family)
MTVHKSSASSRHADRNVASDASTKKEVIVRRTLDPDDPPPRTAEQTKRLEGLDALPEASIDFSDAPMLGEEAWRGAVRGRFYRPRKAQLTLRLDEVVVDWFKRHARGGKGYQTDINQALRDHIAAAEKKDRKKAG